jgi:hypothetical protein
MGSISFQQLSINLVMSLSSYRWAVLNMDSSALAKLFEAPTIDPGAAACVKIDALTRKSKHQGEGDKLGHLCCEVRVLEWG